MNVFYFAFLLAFTLYGFFFERTITIIQGVIFGCYLIGYVLTPNSKFNNIRRKVMIAIFKEQEEPNILTRFECDVSKLNAILEEFPKDSRPSITHFIIRVMAEIFKIAPDFNGRISFGKYIHYQDVNVNCLVDIDGGKDLGVILIEKAQLLYVEEIREYVKEKALKIKNKQCEEQSGRNDIMKKIPSSVLQILFDVLFFISTTLGISLPQLKVKKFQFGTMCVSSLGMLGIRDAFIPNNLVMRNAMFCSVGEVHDKPIVVNDQPEVRPVVILNFTIDHRYLDGGRTKNLNQTIYGAFENPEKYFKCRADQAIS